MHTTVLVSAAISALLSVVLPGDSRAQAIAPAAPVQLRADTILQSGDLLTDVAILRRAYEQLHPGLHRYNTPAQMDAHFAALEREFSRDRTLADAYLALSTFAAKVKCGHTYANFFNQPRAVAEALFRGPRVPFYFRWIDGRMIVTRSVADDTRLVAGTEIVAINGVRASDVLARLMTVARADGNNDAKRVAYLEVQGTSRLEAFDVFFPLFFPMASDRFSLRVRTPGGASAIDIEVPAATYDHRVASLQTAATTAGPDAGPWQFRALDGDIAYLRMPTWALYNSRWNWAAFLRETFATLVASKTADLVIDLRGNEGGSDVGDVIVSHLIAAPVPRPQITRRVRYRQVPDDLVPNLDTWDPSFRDWGPAASEPANGFFKLRRDADDDPGGLIAPAAPRYTGRVWVLVGADNSSATFEFAQIAQQNRLATLVGQPTGGNQRGINGGAFFFVRLPKSGVELDLPLIGQFPDDERPDAGLAPDLPVARTVADVAAGRDAELAATIAAIRKRALIDLAGDVARQVVVDRDPAQYLGHPTTVLLEDGRTIVAVYPKGHGEGGILLKRSTDGGLTWSAHASVPASWATSRETPTIHRVVDASGTKRLVLFSGLYPIRMSLSEDDGTTWSELAPIGTFGGIVAMSSVVRLNTGAGHYLAMFHDDGRFITSDGRKATPAVFTLYGTRSEDGGRTWSAPTAIFRSSDVHLCEPGVIRSPDGRRLAALLRENSRRRNSHVVFSDDEGRTWSEPRELPWTLTGDRHVGAYAPDGRIFVTFRDTAPESPTSGDWLAWVGTWDDIAQQRPGQYRVRLMDNTTAWDCCYPGLEVLPDGTLVTTTYGSWTAGAPPYIASVRLTLAEIDRLAAAQRDDRR